MISKIIHNYSHLLILVFCLSNEIVISQSLNDTLRLSEVEVKSGFSVRNQGFKRVTMDSSFLLSSVNADLATILSQNSTIFIKSYGNGGLATASFRGTTANHTQVEWNGININSPMLGQTDLSTIPVSQFDDIEILYGAAGIAQSSGALGGIINLVTKPDWGNKINLLVSPTITSFDNYFPTIASFHNYDCALKFAFGNNNFQSVTRLNYTNSLNDFLFYDDTLGIHRQKNGSFYHYGLTEELFYKIGKKDYLSGRVWYNNSFNNLPPIVSNLNTNEKNSNQEAVTRAMVEWKRFEKEFSFSLRSAFIDQTMLYLLNGDSIKHHYNSVINRLRGTYSGIRKLTIKPGIDVNYDWVNTKSYDGLKTRTDIALFSEFNYEINKKIQTSFVIREECIDGKFRLPIAALGTNYKPFKKIDFALSANLSRNFRYPTLNELYWDSFGNPLKPETDYSAEIGMVHHFVNHKSNFFIETEITGYYSLIDQLIQWKITGAYTATPENVTQVLARGIEGGLNITWNFKGFSISSHSNYNYCRSTYQKPNSDSPNDNSVGKQLIYIPINTFNSTLNIKKWEYYLSYNFTLVSPRFSDRDNINEMPGYNLSNIIFGKSFLLKKYILSLHLQINNLFNLALRTISNVPEPGRYYALTFRFNFRK